MTTNYPLFKNIYIGLLFFNTITIKLQVIKYNYYKVSDEQLRREIGFLSPDTVTEYVFYLRTELKAKEVALQSLTTVLSTSTSSLNSETLTLSTENRGLKEQIAKLEEEVEKLQSNNENSQGLCFMKLIEIYRLILVL